MGRDEIPCCRAQMHDAGHQRRGEPFRSVLASEMHPGDSAVMRRPGNSPLGEMAFIGGVLTLLMANPPGANAACAVTTAGTVNCDADTTTHQGTNLNGTDRK